MKNIQLSIITSLVLIFLCSCSHEPKLTNNVILSELTNPHEIISDENHLIISDGIEGTSIFVYSLDNFSIYSKFGGTGDTIGKFIVSEGHEVDMGIRNDTLLISSQWKTSFFTKDGNLITEFPIENDTYDYSFLGGQFEGASDTTVNDIMYYTFNIYNKQFDFVKEITRIAGSNQGNNGLQVLVRKYQGLTYNEKFYFKGNSEEFEIEIYDLNGAKKGVFIQTCERIPVEDQHRNDIYMMYKEHPLFGQYFDAIKNRIVFPEYLPAIYNFNIVDDFVYVLTYKADSINSILYKLDLKGKLIDKLNVLIKWKRVTEAYPYTISKDRIYQLVKNKSNKWELQIIEL